MDSLTGPSSNGLANARPERLEILVIEGHVPERRGTLLGGLALDSLFEPMPCGFKLPQLGGVTGEVVPDQSVLGKLLCGRCQLGEGLGQ